MGVVCAASGMQGAPSPKPHRACAVARKQLKGSVSCCVLFEKEQQHLSWLNFCKICPKLTCENTSEKSLGLWWKLGISFFQKIRPWFGALMTVEERTICHHHHRLGGDLVRESSVANDSCHFHTDQKIQWPSKPFPLTNILTVGV